MTDESRQVYKVWKLLSTKKTFVCNPDPTLQDDDYCFYIERYFCLPLASVSQICDTHVRYLLMTDKALDETDPVCATNRVVVRKSCILKNGGQEESQHTFRVRLLQLLYVANSQSSANIRHCGNSISGITAATRLIVGRFASKSRKNELLTKNGKRPIRYVMAMESRYSEWVTPLPTSISALFAI